MSHSLDMPVVISPEASAHPTEEIESSSSDDLWATPNTMDHLPQRSAESMEKMKQGHRKGRTRPSNLREQVCPETNKLWATPAAADAVGSTGGGQGKSLRTDVRMWPTPTTRDHKGGYIGGRERDGKVSWDTLDVAVQYTDNRGKTSGQLNPTWVEWLMGYPEGWTELED